MRKIPFFRPSIGEEEIAEVVKSLKSGWLTTGPQVKRFEEAFAAYVGVPEALAVNSATAGLHLALEALGVGPGDDVVTTDLTFTATAEVIRYLGANPVFCDIREDTLNIDPGEIRRKITPQTKVILVVHFAGYMCAMDEVLAIASEHGLPVVEDAAHCLPAFHGGTMVGALPTAATVFSFYANKTITTGEGGMIVARDPRIISRMKVMRLHGIDRDAFNRFNSDKPAWQYDVVAPGYKYNMTDLAAAIGVHQLAKADHFHSERARAAKLYDQHLADLDIDLAPRPANARDHSWHLYVIRLSGRSQVSRDELVNALYAAGIGCSVHYTPLHRLSYWRDTYQLSANEFPNAERTFERCISLPLYVGMEEDDIAYVADTIRKTLG